MRALSWQTRRERPPSSRPTAITLTPGVIRLPARALRLTAGTVRRRACVIAVLALAGALIMEVGALGAGDWAAQTSPTTQELKAISCANTTHCVAVGKPNGTAATIITTTNGGTEWKTQAYTDANSLLGVSCPTETNCWAVDGKGGVIYTSNAGSTWAAQTSPTTQELRAISCTAHAASTYCWAVGGAGTVISTTEGGSSWSAQTVGAAQLNAVSFASGGRGWAVGATGTLYALVAPCSAGTLSLSGPGSVMFPAVTLNGSDQVSTATPVLTAEDETASAFGWNISATSTTFTNGGSKTLPGTATRFTAAAAAAATGNCSLPTNSIGYPVTLPAAATPPTAVKVFNAAVGSGSGPTNVNMTAQLSVPAGAASGSYSSTWTFTISSGP